MALLIFFVYLELLSLLNAKTYTLLVLFKLLAVRNIDINVKGFEEKNVIQILNSKSGR